MNHKSAPVDIRERLQLSCGEADRLLPELLCHGGIREALYLSTCNRVEVVARVTDSTEVDRGAQVLHLQPGEPQRRGTGQVPLHLPRPGGGPSPLPCDGKPRFDDHGRAADPWADEGCLPDGGGKPDYGDPPQPALPPCLPGGQAGADGDGDRRQRSIGQLCGGRAREEDLRRFQETVGSADRRRRDVGTGGPPPDPAGGAHHLHRQPDLRPGRGDGGRIPGDPPWPSRSFPSSCPRWIS